MPGEGNRARHAGRGEDEGPRDPLAGPDLYRLPARLPLQLGHELVLPRRDDEERPPQRIGDLGLPGKGEERSGARLDLDHPHLVRHPEEGVTGAVRARHPHPRASGGEGGLPADPLPSGSAIPCLAGDGSVPMAHRGVPLPRHRPQDEGLGEEEHGVGHIQPQPDPPQSEHHAENEGQPLHRKGRVM